MCEGVTLTVSHRKYKKIKRIAYPTQRQCRIPQPSYEKVLQQEAQGHATMEGGGQGLPSKEEHPNEATKQQARLHETRTIQNSKETVTSYIQIGTTSRF